MTSEKNIKLDGLSSSVATNLLQTYGYNELNQRRKIPGWLKFLSYFKNPLIIILLCASAISIATSNYNSAIVILMMVFLSIVLNFNLEHKSNQAAEKIAKKLALEALVIRNGREEKITAKMIVPGDIVVLSAGDIIPADGLIISADDFFVNESVLTGESFPVEKSLIKENNQVFSGTNVISGFAKIQVNATGAKTAYGQIAAKLVDTNEINAFEKGIKDFGVLIIKVIVFIVSIIFLINAIGHKNLLESFVFSIAVAVGVTPELLPMIMSVNMAKGSLRMSKKGVLVKRLNAIPDFGSMDILCTDKTGTLTQDKIAVVKYLGVDGLENEDVLRFAYINGHFETGIKSILDEAIITYKKFTVDACKKIDEIPYDFLRKRSSIAFQEKDIKRLVTKGAPEEIFKICTEYINGKTLKKLGAEETKKVVKLYDDLSSQGYRVLAIAYKELKDKRSDYKKDDENKMILAGFVAFYDPPKIEAAETVEFMRAHGVSMKILTGDSPLVAEKVCKDLNIAITGIITGDQFDINVMSAEELEKKVIRNNIFARFSPIQKEAVIKALKKTGAVVGYLGDGINDAPSLKAADVGISVDNAVDVAKETADIILLKKGLKELMDGVLEGRKTFGNTMKYLMMGLSSNFGNMFSMIGASLFLPFFPMLPSQILVNNFLYDCSQISIPSDNVDADYLRKPKHWDIKFIKKFMIVFGPISSLFDFATFYVLYGMFHFSNSLFQAGWFIESLGTQIFIIYIIRTRRLPFIESRPSKYLVITTLSAVVIGFILTLPPIGRYLEFSALPLKALIAIALIILAYLCSTEFIKRLFFKKIYRGSQI